MVRIKSSHVTLAVTAGRRTFVSLCNKKASGKINNFIQILSAVHVEISQNCKNYGKCCINSILNHFNYINYSNAYLWVSASEKFAQVLNTAESLLPWISWILLNLRNVLGIYWITASYPTFLKHIFISRYSSNSRKLRNCEKKIQQNDEAKIINYRWKNIYCAIQAPVVCSGFCYRSRQHGKVLEFLLLPARKLFSLRSWHFFFLC